MARIDTVAMGTIGMGPGPFIAAFEISRPSDDAYSRASLKHGWPSGERFEGLEFAEIFGSGPWQGPDAIANTMSGHGYFDVHTNAGLGAICDIGRSLPSTKGDATGTLWSAHA